MPVQTMLKQPQDSIDYLASWLHKYVKTANEQHAEAERKAAQLARDNALLKEQEDKAREAEEAKAAKAQVCTCPLSVLTC